jgi:hypothetical protein
MEGQNMKEPIAAFGAPPPMSSGDLTNFLTPEVVEVGPIEEDGSAFLLLFATKQNFLFKLERTQLSRLQAAIEQALQNTTSEAH